MDRFVNCGYEVEDDPYCRGFWDRILWNVSFRSDEVHSGASDAYEAGWKAAEMEIVFGV